MARCIDKGVSGQVYLYGQRSKRPADCSEELLVISVPVKTYGGTGGGEVCQFPFSYNNSVYDDCTAVDRDKLWCVTNKTVDGNSTWGYCMGNWMSLYLR